MKSERLIVLILMLSLLFSGCGEKEPQSRDSVSLWCLENEPCAEEISKLAEQYNSELPEGFLPVAVRLFPDEPALAAGFSTMRPDILLCSYLRAQELSSQGLTREIGSELTVPAPEYRSYIYERIPRSGRDIFPVGGNIQLIAAKPGLIELSEKDSFDLKFLAELSERYGRENRLPFFTADSFGALFYQGLLSQGIEFHGDKSRDIKHEEYVKLYNALAESAAEGGTVCSEYPGMALLSSGYLPCAAVSSSEAAKAGSEDFKYYSFDSDSRLSELSCLVSSVREGRDSDSSANFLSWLFSSGRLETLSLKSGLVPVSAEPSSQAGSDLEILLMKTAVSEELHLPEPGCDFITNCNEFEAQYRKALELLS